MQLVAYGAQDVYLTGSPSITFWKLVYRRHTSFALESIEQVFNGSVGYGRKVSATVSRNGDLVTTAYLEITLTRNTGTTYEPYYPAEAFIKEVELEIGGQRIDRVYSDWYRIYDELFRTDAEKDAYKRMTNFDANAPDGQVRKFYLPLIFFFCTNPGLALPLIALQYHEVKLHVTFATAAELSDHGIDTSVEPGCSLWMTYVFLDAEERRRFAQTSHEYLITQLQHTGAETIAPDANTKRTTNVRLNFNHPCKYIAFAAKHPTHHGKFSTVPVADLDDATKNTNEAYGVIESVKLTLNGHDRQAQRPAQYYNQVVPFETCKSRPVAGVYLYSFCLRPQEHQPSGSANFSRIDNSTLIINLKQAKTTNDVIANVKTDQETLDTGTQLTQLLIYATNYNVLRVLSGIEPYIRTVPGCSYTFGHSPKSHHHLCRTASCRSVLRVHATAGKQCKHPVQYNLLVEFRTEFCNTLDCGKLLRAKSTPPFGKPKVSKQGNDLADRKNDLDWTIRRHSPTCAMTSIRRRLRDYQGVRARGLVIPSDRVRYSPSARESVGNSNSPGVDLL